MLSKYDFIYLSPHFDDVALSCGGQIHRRTKVGQSVLIVTIMAGVPSNTVVSDLARGLHDRWQLDANVVAARSAEDEAACAILGADHLHMEIPDCIYRHHPETREPLYGLEAEIFGTVHQADRTLVDKVALGIAVLPKTGQLIVPLAVGHHVDHQITRDAAEQCPKRSLLFYEDYPYVREPDMLDTVIGIERKGWSPNVVRLNKDDLRAKVEAISAYASQMSSFFADHNDLDSQVNEYARQVGGERIWRKMSA